MTKAKEGDTVKILYTGRREDGEIFDSTKGGEPFEFTIGSQIVIAGVEKAVTGMKVGETKRTTIPPEQGFGKRREELLTTVNRSDLPDNIKPYIGQLLEMRQPEGRVKTFFISDMDEETITLDENHPLAGRTLTLTIQLAEIA
jgi:peptidylprolyl isomerase